MNTNILRLCTIRLLIIIVLSAFLFPAVIIPQKKDPDKILQRVVETFNAVKDYEADIKVKVNVEFLKIPGREGKIYFKQPDKIKIESEGFAMLPRQGMDFSPAALLQKKYTAIFEGEADYKGIKTAVIKVIPLGESSEIILSTLWIDESKNFIMKIESTAKLGGTFTIEFEYNESGNRYPLPSSLTFSFNMGEAGIHMRMPEDEDSRGDRRRGTKVAGTVIVSYSNYKVNKGIPDEFFAEKKR